MLNRRTLIAVLFGAAVGGALFFYSLGQTSLLTQIARAGVYVMPGFIAGYFAGRSYVFVGVASGLCAYLIGIPFYEILIDYPAISAIRHIALGALVYGLPNVIGAWAAAYVANSVLPSNHSLQARRP